MRAIAIPAIALAALTLTGCSQVAALAPVGGNAVSEVRYGAIDVLHALGVVIGQAPTCTTRGVVITCAGTTASGQAIAVVSSSDALARLDIEVAGTSVFSGSLQQVLDAAAQQ